MGRKGRKYNKVTHYIVETNKGKIALEADKEEKIKNTINLEFIKFLFDTQAKQKKKMLK